MSELTELEQEADREARHGHRELVERLEARVAELERIALDWEEAAREESNRAEHAVDEQRTAWNDAIRAAMKACHSAAYDGQYPQDDNIELGCLRSRDYIRTLLRKGGDDDQ